MTKLQAHRGVSSECPENTMPAFLLAIEQGYDAIELDPIVTKDLQVVLHHDETINRTGRNLDGSVIEQESRIDEMTLEELNQFDFGIWKHVKFAGTRLPLLKELLPVAREAGVQLKIDAKIFKMTEEHKNVLFDLIRDWQDVCALSTKTVEQTLFVHEHFPQMQVHYGGPCEESALQVMAAQIDKNLLHIWLPYPNLRTAYAYAHLQGLKPGLQQVPEMTAERCRMAKKYGRVCVWNLSDEAQFDAVKALGLYIAETNGEVKPVRNLGVLSDNHTHCDHSHDAKIPMPQIYEGCRSHGIKIMAIADHYDGMFTADGIYDNSHIVASCAEADAITASLNGDGMILRGIELGEGHWDPEQTKAMMEAVDFDVVVGAVHAVKSYLFDGKTGLKRAFSQLKYDDLTARQIYDLMDAYYNDTLEMVSTVDIDIAAHLTCAVGYFVSRHGIYVGVEQFREKIAAILQVLIDRGIALEVNFSGYPATGITSPHKWIIQMYRDMGGYLICMSSDAHSPGRCGVGYEEGIQMLKDMGFRHVFYYKNRKPVQCTLI